MIRPARVPMNASELAVHGRGLVRNAVASARAAWYLRSASSVGARVRVFGRLRVVAHGTLIVGDRVQLSASLARSEIVAAEGAVLEIGSSTLVNFGTSIVATGRITIGADCLIGTHCFIIDSGFHELDPERRLEVPAPLPVTIGRNVWLGARVLVMPGVTIGDDSVVAAGSVVTVDVPPRCLAAGVPARVIREL